MKVKVENIMVKGEIDRLEHFRLFRDVFKSRLLQMRQQNVYVGKS